MVQDKMSDCINHYLEITYRLSICTDIGDLEWRNSRYFALLHRIR